MKQVNLVSFVGLLLLLDTIVHGKRGDTTSIKINEPRVSNQNNYAGSQSNGMNSYNYGGSSAILRRANPPESGKDIVNPQLFSALKAAHKCTETSKQQYRYRVCLFDKVTQHQSWNSWTLGVWKEFKQCDSNLCLRYTDGQKCGNGLPRETDVVLHCSKESSDSSASANNLVLSDISEPVTCHYRMRLRLPILCDLKSPFTSGIDTNTDSTGQTGLDSKTMQWLNESITEIKEHQSLEQSFRLCILQLLNYSQPHNQESTAHTSTNDTTTNSTTEITKLNDQCAEYFAALDSQRKIANERKEKRKQQDKTTEAPSSSVSNDKQFTDQSNDENQNKEDKNDEIEMHSGLDWIMDKDREMDDDEEEDDEKDDEEDIKSWKESLKAMGYTEDDLDGLSDDEIAELMDQVDFADFDF